MEMENNYQYKEIYKDETGDMWDHNIDRYTSWLEDKLKRREVEFMGVVKYLML